VFFFSLLIAGILLTIATYTKPSSIDFVQSHLQVLIKVSPRILLAGFILFLFEQNLDITIFHKIKEKTNNKYLWLRNCFSTITTQSFDTLVFYPIAFYGIYENLTMLMLTALAFKICIALLDTPFMYLSYKFLKKAKA